MLNYLDLKTITAINFCLVYLVYSAYYRFLFIDMTLLIFISVLCRYLYHVSYYWNQWETIVGRFNAYPDPWWPINFWWILNK